MRRKGEFSAVSAVEGPGAGIDEVEEFYDARPDPPPVKDLDGYGARWSDELRRRADFHMHWPTLPYREDVETLVAGCGTSQAARYALRQPEA